MQKSFGNNLYILIYTWFQPMSFLQSLANYPHCSSAYVYNNKPFPCRKMFFPFPNFIEPLECLEWFGRSAIDVRTRKWRCVINFQGCRLKLKVWLTFPRGSWYVLCNLLPKCMNKCVIDPFSPLSFLCDVFLFTASINLVEHQKILVRYFFFRLSIVIQRRNARITSRCIY